MAPASLRVVPHAASPAGSDGTGCSVLSCLLHVLLSLRSLQRFQGAPTRWRARRSYVSRVPFPGRDCRGIGTNLAIPGSSRVVEREVGGAGVVTGIGENMGLPRFKDDDGAHPLVLLESTTITRLQITGDVGAYESVSSV